MRRSMSQRKIKLVVPAGRLRDPVMKLLADAGLTIQAQANDYRPLASDPRFEVKLLRAANIPKLIEFGAHDIGFSGLDWVRETTAEVETLMDTGLMPVRIVSAAPVGSDPFALARSRPVVAASEYERLTTLYMNSRNVDWRYVRTHGATEVFPPEDADLIVDNVSTGRTLAANNLAIVDEILSSSTLFIANRAALDDPDCREAVEELRLLMQSVLDARQRVLLDMNVPASCLETVVQLLPAMKSPTIQPLYKDQGYALRAAVRREEVSRLIPLLKKAGASDLLQTDIQRVIA
ncbi:MAG: ATP phosphoribosyltransferase [Phycisphaerae bacterium]